MVIAPLVQLPMVCCQGYSFILLTNLSNGYYKWNSIIMRSWTNGKIKEYIYLNIQPIWGQHRQNTQDFGKEMTTYKLVHTTHTERGGQKLLRNQMVERTYKRTHIYIYRYVCLCVYIELLNWIGLSTLHGGKRNELYTHMSAGKRNDQMLWFTLNFSHVGTNLDLDICG